jgi:hypothetical protein
MNKLSSIDTADDAFATTASRRPEISVLHCVLIPFAQVLLMGLTCTAVGLNAVCEVVVPTK